MPNAAGASSYRAGAGLPPSTSMGIYAASGASSPRNKALQQRQQSLSDSPTSKGRRRGQRGEAEAKGASAGVDSAAVMRVELMAVRSAHEELTKQYTSACSRAEQATFELERLSGSLDAAEDAAALAEERADAATSERDLARADAAEAEQLFAEATGAKQRAEEVTVGHAQTAAAAGAELQRWRQASGQARGELEHVHAQWAAEQERWQKAAASFDDQLAAAHASADAERSRADAYLEDVEAEKEWRLNAQRDAKHAEQRCNALIQEALTASVEKDAAVSVAAELRELLVAANDRLQGVEKNAGSTKAKARDREMAKTAQHNAASAIARETARKSQAELDLINAELAKSAAARKRAADAARTYKGRCEKAEAEAAALRARVADLEKAEADRAAAVEAAKPKRRSPPKPARKKPPTPDASRLSGTNAPGWWQDDD